MRDDNAAKLHQLIADAFPHPFSIRSISDANQGRGVFSQVLRVELEWVTDTAKGPRSVIAKFPANDANGEAGRRSGAYEREAMAYRQLLPDSPVQAPIAHLVRPDGNRGASFVLEDLTEHRRVDQLDGLSLTDCLAVTAELRRLHQHWQQRAELAGLDLRRATPTTFDHKSLKTGLDVLTSRWGSWLDSDQLRAFQRLVHHRVDLVTAFAQAGVPTLCHGDPRADNLVFDRSGRPILFDWQQIAIQLGEADLAWLAATSLTVDDRRHADTELVSAYGTSLDRYRLGFILPGLAVLLLAQRRVNDSRSTRFISTSLTRIGSALSDLEIGAELT